MPTQFLRSCRVTQGFMCSRPALYLSYRPVTKSLLRHILRQYQNILKLPIKLFPELGTNPTEKLAWMWEWKIRKIKLGRT